MREGSVVVGRVLEKTGSLYTISLAGKMISVKSKENLTPGSIFRGTIKIVDGKKVEIALLRGDEKSKTLTKSEILESRIASLGLEKNETVMRLLDFMTTLGMKLDSEKMRKAVAKGKSNGEKDASRASATKESKKSEIWLLGDENGRDLSDDALERIVYGEKDELEKFNARDEKDLRHWFVLPFEWDYMKMTGDLKILEKFPDKIVEKVVVDIEGGTDGDLKYRFFLEFDNNRFKRVFVLGCESRLLKEFLFKNGFPNVEVEGGDGDEKIFSVLKGVDAEV